MNKKYVGLFTSAGLAFLPAMASAAGPSLSDVLVNSGITANGYVSASYNATFNSTDGSTVAQVPLHQFDTNSNTFSLNQAALTLSYQPTSGFGGLVNVITGEDAKAINAAYSGGSSGSDFALTQAFVQYAVGNLTVIGGRFVTLAGWEVIDDTKNANISRSLLFTNLEPLVHTGVRATYKFSDMITANLGVNNSASGVSADTDKHKTLEANLSLTPSSTTAVYITDYYSVDGSTGNAKTNFLDAVGSWQATSALLLAANFDYVHSVVSDSSVATVNREGGALYATYQFNDSWKGSVRGEYARVKPGGAQVVDTGEGTTLATATSSNVASFTATVDYSASKNFDVLGEFREDYGTDLFFPSSNNTTSGLQKSQGEVLVKAIYKFGTPASS